MATRVWDDDTEGEVWVVESADSESDSISSWDTDSTMDTMSTIQSKDAPATAYFRVEYGRAFPAHEGIPMVFPSDNGEMRRLRTQHLAVKLVAGETLDEIVSAHLSSNLDGRRKRVLDVRTQTGIWADETATKFPKVAITSIDVVPTIPHIPRANLRHEVYNIHEGIIDMDGTFDAVHAEYTMGMVNDWISLLKDMHRVLRPGGLFVFGEILPPITLPGERLPRPQGPASQAARLCGDILKIMADKGIQVMRSGDVEVWLSPESGLWGSESTLGFHSIVHRVWEMPIGGLWHPDPVMQQVGLLMALNISQLAESSRPLFLASGLAESEFDVRVNDIRKELQDPMNNAVLSYQDKAVSAYIKSLGRTYDGLYNRTGRWFPDVSAEGRSYLFVHKGKAAPIMGTSAACPTFAGVITLLNDYRLSKGTSHPHLLSVDFRTRHALREVPSGWTTVASAPAEHLIDMRIGLKQARMDELLTTLYEVSDPAHARYGMHFSKAEVEELVAPRDETVKAIEEWQTFTASKLPSARPLEIGYMS
ncbi:hypothetical protein FRC10_010019 [Ceratobasidium sp. 414]|nr:hypothetical protein FRC10_010019 [Ceratobasidium sp. 414]